jgi:hypothetical protein
VWPVVGGVLTFIAPFIVIPLGVYYDTIGKSPGTLVMLGISLLCTPWFGYARWQWVREREWVQDRKHARRVEMRAAVLLKPLARRHRDNITGVFERIDAELDADRRALGPGDDDDE